MIRIRKLNLTNVTKVQSTVRIRKHSSKTRECAEIRIPVPWGHIAGKWWGSQNNRPILGCHGWQDNSGTFDRIVPYIPENVGFLAIDLPGHGYSSRIPPGMFYHGFDYVIVIERIIEYFKWPKVSLIGHSLGGMLSYENSVLFPERVEFLICLESFHGLPSDNRKSDEIRKVITKFLKYDNLSTFTDEPPSYTTEKLSQAWHEGSYKSVAVENCKDILERNILPSKIIPNQFYFTSDPRLKAGVEYFISRKQIIEQAQRVTFPICIFKADDSVFFKTTSLMKEVLDIIKRINKNCRFIQVKGTHHVHLNNPERVGPHIHDFIKMYTSDKRQLAENI